MRTRIGVIALIALMSMVIGLGGVQRAHSQEEEPRNYVYIGYPQEGISFGEKDGAPVKYKGSVHIEAYALAPAKLKMRAEGLPLGVADLTPSNGFRLHLPYGTYEIQFSARVGGELRRTIKRVIIERQNTPELYVDLAESRLFRYGADMTALEMQTIIARLQEEVKALQAEVAELKKK